MSNARVYNFSAGPSMLPLQVLERAGSEITNYQGSGMSVMEMSHRSKVFQIGEVAGDGIVGLACLSNKIQGHGGELGGGAALEEEDLVALRDLQQTAELGLGVVKDLLKHL